MRKLYVLFVLILLSPVVLAQEAIRETYREGEIFLNPDTGERIILRNNEWIPLSDEEFANLQFLELAESEGLQE